MADFLIGFEKIWGNNWENEHGFLTKKSRTNKSFEIEHDLWQTFVVCCEGAVSYFACWLPGLLACLLACLVGWLVACLLGWLIGWLVG